MILHVNGILMLGSDYFMKEEYLSVKDFKCKDRMALKLKRRTSTGFNGNRIRKQELCSENNGSYKS